MRQTFENRETLEAEREFRKRLEDRWGCVLKKMPRAYEIDFCSTQNEDICAWVEAKCRNNTHSKYSTYMLSLHKYFAGKRLSEETGVPFRLAVRFTNIDMVYEYSPKHNLKLVMRGRTVQQRDWQDTEPVVLIPMTYFKEV